MPLEDLELLYSQIYSLKNHAVSYQFYDVAIKLKEVEKMIRSKLNRRYNIEIERNVLDVKRK